MDEEQFQAAQRLTTAITFREDKALTHVAHAFDCPECIRLYATIRKWKKRAKRKPRCVKPGP